MLDGLTKGEQLGVPWPRGSSLTLVSFQRASN